MQAYTPDKNVMADVKFYNKVRYCCILILLLGSTASHAKELKDNYWEASRKIDSFFKKQSFVEGRALCRQVLKQAKQQGRFKRAAECRYNLGRSFRSENLDSASEHYYKALSVGEGLKDDSIQFFVLSDLALLNKKRSYFRLASDYFYQALRTKTGSESDLLKFNLFISLGNIHRELGQVRKTFKYLRKAKVYFQGINDHKKSAECMNSLGKAMISTEAYDSALVQLKGALKIYDSLNSQHALIVHFNLGDAHYYKGDLAAAKKSWEAILMLSDKREHRMYTWVKLANLYLDLEDVDAAMTYVNFLEQESAGSSPVPIYLLRDGHQIKYRLANLQGDFKQALIEKEAEHHWQQESLNADVMKSIGEWETKFQFDEMRGSLARQRFEIERGILQNDLLKQQNAIFAIAAIVFMLSVVFAVAWGYRERRFKQLKERMLKEFNHRVRNNLNALSGLFRLQLKQMGDGAARASIMEGKSRLETLTLLYNQLDPQNQKSLTVRFDLYLKELIGNAMKILEVGPLFEVSYNIGESLIDADRATYYGLIVNEIVTNACKHGTSHLNPQLEIVLQNGWLTIRDNGDGLPDDFDSSDAKTMGLQLTTELANQLAVTHEFVNNKGLGFKIEVK